ncbi:MAG TPA: PQQ-dependent sugar dehydrogenase, partial [Thermoanaerobaculia bacterium]|nr:PQQ-dependent sugar dehydrogenase [Thermoanaerobaculia bacterium]
AVGENAVNPSNAQNLNILLGKILRINADGTPPVDNPFYNQAPKRGEIWLYGVRNPFTFAFHPTSGKLHVNDVGQTAYEEIDLGVRGKNYGWPLCEGPCSPTNPMYIDPIYSYPHISYCGRPAGGAAIIGAAFYTGGAYPPEYADAFFFGELVQQFIKYLDTSNVVHDFACGVDTLVDLQLGPDGNLYYANRPFVGSSGIYRIRYTAGANRPPTAAATASPMAGPTPLLVSFDASASSDPDGDPLTYAWDFGDGAMGTGVAPMHSYGTAATRTVTLTVNDGKMQPNSTNMTMLTVVPGDNPPVPTILTPAMGTTYDALQNISYTGTATDADETLSAAAYSWTIVFHHNIHTHPFLGPIDGVTSGMFQIPNVGEPATDTYYRIHLRVTDSSGVSVETTRDVTPNLVNLTLQTSPANLSVTLDGQPVTTPYTFPSVVNFQRSLGPVNPQTYMSTCYELSSWSDAGAATHAIAAPMSPATYTATYTPNGAPPSVMPPVDATITQTICIP